MATQEHTTTTMNRGLLTEGEREFYRGDKPDIEDPQGYRYNVRSRFRDRLDELETDIQILREAGEDDLVDEFSQRMELSRRELLGAVGIAGLAGCTGVSDNDTADNANTTTNALSEDTAIQDVTLDDPNNTPGIRVTFDIDDYGTLMLEDTSGEILKEDRISPSANEHHFETRFAMEGSYKVVLRQNGETTGSEIISFDGASIEIGAITQRWDGNALEGIDLPITNTGDFYAIITSLNYELQGDTVQKHFGYYYIRPSSTETISIAP